MFIRSSDTAATAVIAIIVVVKMNRHLGRLVARTFSSAAPACSGIHVAHYIGQWVGRPFVARDISVLYLKITLGSFESAARCVLRFIGCMQFRSGLGTALTLGYLRDIAHRSNSESRLRTVQVDRGPMVRGCSRSTAIASFLSIQVT